MQHLPRISLAVAFVAALGQVFVSAPAFAQPPQPRRVEVPTPGEFVLPAQIESIDAEAKTVAMRNAKIAPGTTPIVTPEGATQVQMVAGELEIVPLAVGAPVIRLEPALASGDLKIGDIVSLLGQKAAPGHLRLQRGDIEPDMMQREALRPAPPTPRSVARYNSKAEYFRVVALSPLTLRKGGEPTPGKEESVLNVPFTNGPNSLPIGTLSVGTIEGGFTLSYQRGNLKPVADIGPANKDLRRYIPLKEGTDFPVVTENYVVTLKLTKVEGLEFDRFSALKLSDVAAGFAAGEISVSPELGESPDGKRVINRLVITDEN